MFGGLLEKAKQAQEEMKERLSEMRIRKSIDNGAIKLEIDGNKKVLSIHIAEELISEGNKERIEDLMIVLLNKANEDAESKMQEEMKNLAGGILPPGLF